MYKKLWEQKQCHVDGGKIVTKKQIRFFPDWNCRSWITKDMKYEDVGRFIVVLDMPYVEIGIRFTIGNTTIEGYGKKKEEVEKTISIRTQLDAVGGALDEIKAKSKQMFNMDDTSTHNVLRRLSYFNTEFPNDDIHSTTQLGIKFYDIGDE